MKRFGMRLGVTLLLLASSAIGGFVLGAMFLAGLWAEAGDIVRNSERDGK